MNKARYNFGFTAGAFLYGYSVILAKEYIKTYDWQKAKEEVIKQNLFQIRTVSGQKRILTEVYTRLSSLGDKALSLIATGTRDEQVQLLWYAICKKYFIIGDFIKEVIIPKINSLDFVLDTSDFYYFINTKAMLYEELNRISDQTRRRLQLNLYQMLREAGMMTKERRFQPVFLSPVIKQFLADENVPSQSIFPFQS